MEMILRPESGEARRKMKQVYEYLHELYRIKNPVKTQIEEQLWSLSLSNLPLHQGIVLVKRDESWDTNGAELDELDVSGDLPPILRVTRPPLSEAPEPPAIIKDWLHENWHLPDWKPEYIEARSLSNTRNGNETPIIRFEDDLERPQAFREWVTQWTLWAKE